MGYDELVYLFSGNGILGIRSVVTVENRAVQLQPHSMVLCGGRNYADRANALPGNQSRPDMQGS